MILVIAQIVYRVQLRSQYFVALVEMMQIGAAEVLTGVAIAAVVQRRRAVAMDRIANPDDPAGREQMPVAGVARRHDTVEHIHAATDALQHIRRRAHTHQIARRVIRHMRGESVEHGEHSVFGLAHREPAYGIAVKADVLQSIQATPAQILVQAALDNAEQSRRLLTVRAATALCPAQGAFHGLPSLLRRRGIRRALVKNHDDIAAQGALHGHGSLRVQKYLGAIDRRAKGHAGLADLAHGAQAEDLKTAGIAQDRTGPVHEIVEIAMRGDHLGTRAQPQVKGIAENDLRAKRFEVSRQHALDGAVGADGHKRGGLDHAPLKYQPAQPRRAVARRALEAHQPRAPGAGVNNMASP